MIESNRPLSPHLQIYRLPLLALISITHRATGVALSIAAILLPLALYCVAAGPETYELLQTHSSAWYGRSFLFLCSVGMNFHLLNGIRHLVWDTGKNLDVAGAEKSAHGLLLAVILLTALLWYLACTGIFGGEL